jgi:hypothetical protein
MKCCIGLTTLVLTLFAMFVVTAAPSAYAQQCSLAGAAGPYGFTGTGTLFYQPEQFRLQLSVGLTYAQTELWWERRPEAWAAISLTRR